MNGFTIYAGSDMLFSSVSGDPGTYLVSPSLKLETGKAGSLKFTILPTHVLYNSLKQMKSLIKVYWDDTLIFRGRVFSLDKNIFLQRKVECEGDLTFLNDVTMDEITVTETPAQFFSRCIEDYNSKVDEDHQFIVGDVTIREKDKELEFKINPFSNVLSVIESGLINTLGGYLVPRYTENGVYLDYVAKFETVQEQKIEFARNLIDFQEDLAGDDIFTVLIPTGKDGLTIKDIVRTEQIVLPNGTVISTKQGDPKIYFPDGISEYGTIERPESFSEISDAAELMDKATDYIEDNYKQYPSVLDLTALDFHFLDPSIPFMLPGYRITVKSMPHQVNANYVCTAATLYFLDPEDNEYTMDDPSQESAKAGGSASSSYSRASGRSLGKITSDMIEWNKDKIEIASKNISLIASDLLLLKGDTVEIQGRIIDIGAKLTQHQKDIMEGMETIIALNADVVAMDAQMIDMHSKLLEIESNVITVDSKYIGINSHMSEIDQWLVGHDKKIIDLEADGLHINTELNGIEAELVNNNKKVIAIDADVIRLGQGLTQAQQDLVNQNESITAINTDILSVTGRLTRIESETTEIESDIVSINGREKVLINGGTVEIDGTQYTIVNGMTVMSQGIQGLIDGGRFTYVDANGITQTRTLSGEVAVKNLIAGKASIGELNAAIARIDTIETNYLTADNISSRHIAVGSLQSAGGVQCQQLTASTVVMGGINLQGIDDAIVGISNGTTAADGTTTVRYSRFDGGIGTFSFNAAGSVTLDGDWSGNRYTVTASNGKAISILVTADITSIGYNSSDHLFYPTAVVWSEGGVKDTYVSQWGLGGQAYTDGQKSATLTAGGWVNGTNKVTNDYNSSKFVNVSLPSIDSYTAIALTSTDTGTSVSKTCVAHIGGTTRSHALTIDASAVYSQGVKDGEDAFKSVGTVYTVPDGTTLYAAEASDYEYYDVGKTYAGKTLYTLGTKHTASAYIFYTRNTTGYTAHQRMMFPDKATSTQPQTVYDIGASGTFYTSTGAASGYHISGLGAGSVLYEMGDPVTPTKVTGRNIGTEYTPTEKTDYYTKS